MSESNEYWDKLDEPRSGIAAEIPQIKRDTKQRESSTRTGDEYYDGFTKEVFGTRQEIQTEYDNKQKRSVAKLSEYCKKNNKLVLVLGAGVSIDCGLPSWESLVKKLLLKSWSESSNLMENTELFTKSTSLHPIIATRFVRQLIEIEKEDFNNVVHNRLYESYQQSSSQLLEEIVEWCRIGKVDCIITYNFDNILEQYLDKEGVQYVSIFKNSPDILEEQLVIYHVHGFLPQHPPKGENSSSAPIIFSEEDYHRQYQESYNWNTLIQLDKYRNHTCLFIGTSLTDPNQRRLLDVSKNYYPREAMRHYVFRKRMGTLDETVEKIWDHIYNRIDAAFGINTIWVDDHNKIPEILKELRLNEEFESSINSESKSMQ